MPRPYHNNFNKPSNEFKVDNEFNKKLRLLKKYCPQTYKYLIFELKNSGTFNVKDGEYEIDLPTSPEFKFIYGQIKLKYYVKNNNPIFTDLEPSKFLIDGYKSDLCIYKSLYYRDARDKFKIDLLYQIKETEKSNKLEVLY